MASAFDRGLFRELKRAGKVVRPWDPAGNADRAYIVDLAHEAGVSVVEATPLLLALDRETPGGILARLDLVAAGDPKKIRESTITRGTTYGGVQLVRLPALAKAKMPAMNENGRSYFVWAVNGKGEPVGDPEGPYREWIAKGSARTSARHSRNDRVVSLGSEIGLSSFKVVAGYRAGSGDQVF